MPEAGEALWLTEQDVVDLVDLHDALEAVRRFLRLAANGSAKTMPKTQLSWGGGHSLHAIGAVAPESALVGTKTWAHTAGGATPLVILWDSETGRLQAIVEAFALGQLRTASVSAVATEVLADPGADRLALIGTGKQALPQLAAVVAVRSLELVRVHSPTPGHAEQFIEAAHRAGFDLKLEGASSVAAAARDASVVTTVTRARQPFLSAADLAHGAHVNAVGAIAPERQELHDDVAEAADLVVADDPATARRVSRELAAVADDGVQALSAVVAGNVRRSADPRLTLCKAVGIGLADLAVASAALERAHASRRGRRLDQPSKSQPRLTGARS